MVTVDGFQVSGTNGFVANPAVSLLRYGDADGNEKTLIVEKYSNSIGTDNRPLTHL